MLSKILGKTAKIWEEAYKAEIRFYIKNGGILGAYALTEDTDTVLPCSPDFQIDGTPVKMLELCLITFDGGPQIGSVDYRTAIKVLKQNNPLEKNGHILVKGMSREQLTRLYNKCLLL